MLVKNKDIVGVFVATAAILVIPLIAMQVSNEWDWKVSDFVIIGILLLGTGFLIVLAARKIKSTNRRIVVILGLLALLLLTWAHLAVGIVDSWPLAGS